MPFKGCLSDACVLMKIERFVLKPLRKIERFVLKQHTFRFADYTNIVSVQLPFIQRCIRTSRDAIVSFITLPYWTPAQEYK